MFRKKICRYLNLGGRINASSILKAYRNWQLYAAIAISIIIFLEKKPIGRTSIKELRDAVKDFNLIFLWSQIIFLRGKQEAAGNQYKGK
jgi:hypothetical protein